MDSRPSGQNVSGAYEDQEKTTYAWSSRVDAERTAHLTTWISPPAYGSRGAAVSVKYGLSSVMAQIRARGENADGSTKGLKTLAAERYCLGVRTSVDVSAYPPQLVSWLRYA